MKWQAIRLDFVEDYVSGDYLLVTYKNQHGETKKEKEALTVCESEMGGLYEVKMDLMRQIREKYGYNVLISEKLRQEVEAIAEMIVYGRGKEHLDDVMTYFGHRKKTCDAKIQKWLNKKNDEAAEDEEMDFIRATW